MRYGHLDSCSGTLRVGKIQFGDDYLSMPKIGHSNGLTAIESRGAFGFVGPLGSNDIIAALIMFEFPVHREC